MNTLTEALYEYIKKHAKDITGRIYSDGVLLKEFPCEIAFISSPQSTVVFQPTEVKKFKVNKDMLMTIAIAIKMEDGEIEGVISPLMRNIPVKKGYTVIIDKDGLAFSGGKEHEH